MRAFRKRDEIIATLVRASNGRFSIAHKALVICANRARGRLLRIEDVLAEITRIRSTQEEER